MEKVIFFPLSGPHSIELISLTQCPITEIIHRSHALFRIPPPHFPRSSHTRENT